MLILVGITPEDTEADIHYLVSKALQLRIFDDEAGVMNRSVLEVEGEVTVVSQFTLLADTHKGNRPSYLRAARGEQAEPLYNKVVQTLQERLGKPVGTGRFGADMQVSLVNDGPVTIWIDSQNRSY
jgi:D-tyrosyl-tRNA(Tyr) deacylase